jgi:outer membrane protein assembly factor BamB
MRCLLPLLFCSLAVHAQQNWPQWRGPGGQGHAETTGLPTTWSETESVAWKRELPGRGWSSPVIWGKQIWVTTAIEHNASPEETAKRLKANTGDQPLTVLASVSLRALCIDRESGEIISDNEVLKVKDPQWVHQLNSYASPTPVIEEGRLYCHFGAFGSACVDTQSGSVLWRNQETQIMHENGPGSTPVLWQDKLIFHCDGSDKQFICALNKHTGEIVWKTDRSGEMHANPQQKKAYGTPLVVEMSGQPTLVSTAADWVYGYAPDTGKELWKVAYGQLGFSMSPRPVAGLGMIFFSTSFGKPEVFALKYEGLKTPEIVWHSFKNGPNIPSPLLAGDELYTISDGGIFSCVDARTGKEHYRERLGGKFTSSPLLADGRIYVCSREGVTSVVKAGTTFKTLAQNKLDGGIYGSPAAVDGTLFVRTDKALYRIGKN